MSLLFSFQLFVRSTSCFTFHLPTYFPSHSLPPPTHAHRNWFAGWVSVKRLVFRVALTSPWIAVTRSGSARVSNYSTSFNSLNFIPTFNSLSLARWNYWLTDSWPIYAGFAFCWFAPFVTRSVFFSHFPINWFCPLTHRHCRIRLLVDSRNGQIVILTPYTLV